MIEDDLTHQGGAVEPDTISPLGNKHKTAENPLCSLFIAILLPFLLTFFEGIHLT
ncbi:hypothetical protein [Propionispora vibrioides]|uniref:Uncharacterized protein n=1 Tax=Propionispora vibrioides TaxID=112903 RepID=A0A1H8WNG3_9FIRM|nr:hypothetical protein [Propionispora vibrioides]SEP29244.1 hypothetical protein SAMN04490178_1172 [Propionispora vibrioides]